MKTSGRDATCAWNRAYEAFPGYAADYAWPHIIEVLEAHPGARVYEIGFGSGMNLRWARENGWEVAGCDVADAAMARAARELPGADLRQESITECSAPSAYYDVVFDRAALICLSPSEMKKAIAQVRRILKPGGVMFFNPYGTMHTWPFPEGMPPATRWDEQSVHRLFRDTQWELLDIGHAGGQASNGNGTYVEHTLRVLARKLPV